MREKTIEKYLTDRVKERRGLCLKFVPTFFAGFPDRIVFLPGGVFHLIELKAPGGVLSAIQSFVHKKLRALGFTVHVFDSREQINELIP